MDRLPRVAIAIGTVVLVGFFLVDVGLVPALGTTDRAEVTIVGDDGEEKATVDAEVADTWTERYTGLSEHDSLADGEGMLFVHDSEGDRTYVMRDMDFGIDIIFVDADGEITTIHEACAPGPDEDGEELTYEGRAKWVLEVPLGYADERGIEEGDELEIEYE